MEQLQNITDTIYAEKVSELFESYSLQRKRKRNGVFPSPFCSVKRNEIQKHNFNGEGGNVLC